MAIEIGNRLFIKGDWDPTPTPPGKVLVTLVPQAHSKEGQPAAPWTRSMLEKLDELVQPGMVVVDLGSGNAVLALAAAALGADSVLAFEMRSRLAAPGHRNIAANNMGNKIQLLEENFVGTTRIPNQADLVVADMDTRATVKVSGGLAISKLAQNRHFVTMPETRHVREMDAAFPGLALVEQVSVGDRWSRLDFVRGA